MFDSDARRQWTTSDFAAASTLDEADLLGHSLGVTLAIDAHEVSIRVLSLS
jgi:hypothetical protein